MPVERSNEVVRRTLPVSPATALIAVAFLVDLYVAMVSLATQNLGIYVMRVAPLMLGLFATVSSVAYTIGCLLSGSISDRYGRRRCALVGCLGAAAAWVLVPHAPDARFVLMLVTIPGLSLAMFWPSVQAWLAELAGSDRRALSTSIGRFNIMWCAGLMLGPVATGYLWGWNWAATFYIPAALMFVVVLLLAFVPRGARGPEGDGAETNGAHENTALFLRLAWVGNFASFFATRTISAMFPALGAEMEFSNPQVGWLLFSVGAGQILIFTYTSWEHRWQYKLWPMVVAQAGAALGMILAALGQGSAAFAAGFALVGVSAGVTYVSSLFYALHRRSQGRGKTSGFHEAVLGSGVLLGPLLGGIAAQTFSFRAPFAVAAVVLIAACLVQIGMSAADRAKRVDGLAVAMGTEGLEE